MPYERPVDSEGRILLPKEVREALDLEAGDTVSITEEDGEVTIEVQEPDVADLQRRNHGSPARVNTTKPDRSPETEE